MDAVFFSLKRAFHATLRCGRSVLGRVGLTPARFDVLIALTAKPLDKNEPNTQAALRKMLGLARATMCEMLAALEQRGWISRTRSTRDRRTFCVSLTRAGRDLVEKAYELAVGTGWVPLAVDYAVGGGSMDDDQVFAARDWLDTVSQRVRRYFGDSAIRELYPWHPDEYLSALLGIESDPGALLSCEPPHLPLPAERIDELTRRPDAREA